MYMPMNDYDLDLTCLNGIINTPSPRDGPESAFLVDRRAPSLGKRIEPLGSGVFRSPWWWNRDSPSRGG